MKNKWMIAIRRTSIVDSVLIKSIAEVERRLGWRVVIVTAGIRFLAARENDALALLAEQDQKLRIAVVMLTSLEWSAGNWEKIDEE